MPFEREVFFYLKENLPKGTDVCDEINRFLLETKERLEKEKNENSLNCSPIRPELVSYTTNKPDNYDKITLDIYLLPQNEINKRLSTIEDLETLRQLRIKAGIIVDITKTSIHNKIKKEKMI